MKTIAIEDMDRDVMELWLAVAGVVALIPGEWVLVGGLMVQLHAIELGELKVRVTRDIDVLGQARPQGTLPAIDAALRAAQFVRGDPDLDGYGHRYERDGIQIDVLAPDGIKPPPELAEGLSAIGVPGGSQALSRSECVTVNVAGRAFILRRPTLLGAILIKARSLMVHHDPASQREDLLRLLSLVKDPRELASEMKKRERTWLKHAEARLDFGGPSQLDARRQQLAELTFRLLTALPFPSRPEDSGP